MFLQTDIFLCCGAKINSDIQHSQPVTHSGHLCWRPKASWEFLPVSISRAGWLMIDLWMLLPWVALRWRWCDSCRVVIKVLQGGILKQVYASINIALWWYGLRWKSTLFLEDQAICRLHNILLLMFPPEFNAAVSNRTPFFSFLTPGTTFSPGPHPDLT